MLPTSNMVINMGQPRFNNLIKNSGLGGTIPGNDSGIGTPVVMPPTSVTAGGLPMEPDYYGDYLVKWPNTGALQVAAASFIVRSGHSFVPGLSPNNSTPFNLFISGANPRVIFAYGFEVTSIVDSGIDNGVGGTLVRVNIKTSTLNVSSGTGGPLVKMTGITSGQTQLNGQKFLAQRNTLDGTDRSFFLLGSAWNSGLGASGAGSEAIFAPASPAMYYPTGYAYSGMGEPVFCTTAKESIVDAGILVDQAYIDTLVAPTGIAPRVLRGMDIMRVQSSLDCIAALRKPKEYVSFSGDYVRNELLTTSGSKAITNDGSDGYTCAFPSYYASAGITTLDQLPDGATVQGFPSATNAGFNPKLNMGGIGAGVIMPASLDQRNAVMILGGTLPQYGDTITVHITSPIDYTYIYTVKNNGHFGDDRNVTGFAPFHWLGANLTYELAENATIKAANLQLANRGSGNCGWLWNRNLTRGTELAVTFTLPSGMTIDLGTCSASKIDATKIATFTWSKLMRCWLYKSGGIISGVPWEVALEIYNRVGADDWDNIPIIYPKASYDIRVAFWRDGLLPELSYGSEKVNELWNSSQGPYAQSIVLGACLNWSIPGFEATQYYAALCCCLMAKDGLTVWTATGRTAATWKPRFAWMHVNGGGDVIGALRGTKLNPSTNTYLASYGGWDAGALSYNFSASPNRTGDLIYSAGGAPYWGHKYFSYYATDILGTAVQNSEWLVAAYNFKIGKRQLAYDQWDAMILSGAAPAGNRGQVLSVTSQHDTNWQGFLNDIDTLRLANGLGRVAYSEYEGGFQVGLGHQFSGTNDDAASRTEAISDVQARLSGSTLNWTDADVQAFGFTDIADAATQLVELSIQWRRSGNARHMYSKKYQMANRIFSNRIFECAHYGFEGPHNWGIWAGKFGVDPPYTYFDSMFRRNRGLRYMKVK